MNNYEHLSPYNGCDIYQGDALDVLPMLAEQGIKADMILTDPPYGTTHCRWDSPIDITKMWQVLRGVTMPSTPILLFCQQPFTSVLGASTSSSYATRGCGRRHSLRAFSMPSVCL